MEQQLTPDDLNTFISDAMKVGINPLSYFDGEEQLLTMSSFEAGYYLYAPTEIKVYHFAGSGEYTTKQWFKPVISMDKYSECVRVSIKQWTDYIENVQEDVLIDYFKYCGVDYINKKIEDRTRDYPALISKLDYPLTENETHTVVDNESEITNDTGSETE